MRVLSASRLKLDGTNNIFDKNRLNNNYVMPINLGEPNTQILAQIYTQFDQIKMRPSPNVVGCHVPTKTRKTVSSFPIALGFQFDR